MKKKLSSSYMIPNTNTLDCTNQPFREQNIGTGSSFNTIEENSDATESQIHSQIVKKEVYHFDRYDITVLLSMEGKFCGICSVKEARDFLSTEQFLKNTPSIDTDDFYTGEDN